MQGGSKAGTKSLTLHLPPLHMWVVGQTQVPSQGASVVHVPCRQQGTGVCDLRVQPGALNIYAISAVELRRDRPGAKQGSCRLHGGLPCMCRSRTGVPRWGILC